MSLPDNYPLPPRRLVLESRATPQTRVRRSRTATRVFLAPSAVKHSLKHTLHLTSNLLCHLEKLEELESFAARIRTLAQRAQRPWRQTGPDVPRTRSQSSPNNKWQYFCQEQDPQFRKKTVVLPLVGNNSGSSID